MPCVAFGLLAMAKAASVDKEKCYNWWMWRCDDRSVVRKVQDRFAGLGRPTRGKIHQEAVDADKTEMTKDGVVFYRTKPANLEGD